MTKKVEVRFRSKYRKGRRYENGRSTEKVELMRTQIFHKNVKIKKIKKNVPVFGHAIRGHALSGHDTLV